MNINEQFMDAISFLQDYMTLIAIVVGFIVQWTLLQTKIKDHEKRITTLESEGSSLNLAIQDIKVRLASIETMLKMMMDKK